MTPNFVVLEPFALSGPFTFASDSTVSGRPRATYLLHQKGFAMLSIAIKDRGTFLIGDPSTEDVIAVRLTKTKSPYLVKAHIQAPKDITVDPRNQRRNQHRLNHKSQWRRYFRPRWPQRTDRWRKTGQCFRARRKLEY